MCLFYYYNTLKTMGQYSQPQQLFDYFYDFNDDDESIELNPDDTDCKCDLCKFCDMINYFFNVLFYPIVR